MIKFARLLALLVGAVCALLLFVYSLPLLSRLTGDASSGGPEGIWLWWLASGVGVALCIGFYRYVQRVERQRDEIDAADALRQARFTASGRPLLLGFATVGMCAMCTLALVLGIDAGDWPMAALSCGLLLPFLLASYEIGRQALRPGPMLAMDGRGIEHALYGFIPWGDVVGLCLQTSQVRYSTISNLMLGVRTPQRYIAQTSWLYRWQKRGWVRQPPAFGTLQIGLNLLDKKPELIHRAAVALRERVATPMLAHWHPAMTEHQVRTFLEMQALSDDLQTVRDDSPAQMEALLQRVTAMQPDLDRATQDGLAHTQRAKRNAAWLTAVSVVVFVFWLGSQLLR